MQRVSTASDQESYQIRVGWLGNGGCRSDDREMGLRGGGVILLGVGLMPLVAAVEVLAVEATKYQLQPL